jgi:hypothetical protein
MEAATGPVETGLMPNLIPDEEVKARTNARSKRFLRRYPHLFQLHFQPPRWLVFRSDWTLPEDSAPEHMTTEELAMSLAAILIEAKTLAKSKPVGLNKIFDRMPVPLRKHVKGPRGLKEILISMPNFFCVEEGNITLVEADGAQKNGAHDGG